MAKFNFTITGVAETVDEEGNPKEPGNGLNPNNVNSAIEEVINDNDLGTFDEDGEEIFLDIIFTFSDATEVPGENA
jgi:hypothetical protein